MIFVWIISNEHRLRISKRLWWSIIRWTWLLNQLFIITSGKQGKELGAIAETVHSFEWIRVCDASWNENSHNHIILNTFCSVISVKWNRVFHHWPVCRCVAMPMGINRTRTDIARVVRHNSNWRMAANEIRILCQNSKSYKTWICIILSKLHLVSR